MNEIIKSSKDLALALSDLTNMLASEDPGATYVSRLADEAEQLYVLILSHAYKDLETNIFPALTV